MSTESRPTAYGTKMRIFQHNTDSITKPNCANVEIYGFQYHEYRKIAECVRNTGTISKRVIKRDRMMISQVRK